MKKRQQDGARRAPFSREEIEMETRRAALAMASLISSFGSFKGAGDHAAQYLGVALEDYDLEPNDAEVLMQIPIEKHFLHRVVMDAYSYAYQVDLPSIYDVNMDERATEVSGILTGFPQTDFQGAPSPLDKLNPQKFRQVLDTFMARWSLDSGFDLTVRDLALLANMGEAAVRTSLSAEGIKTIPSARYDGDEIPHAARHSRNQVPNDAAARWLLGRRGFVPTFVVDGEADAENMIAQIFDSADLDFPQALSEAVAVLGVDLTILADRAGVERSVIEGLLASDTVVDVDVPAFQRLGKALGAPVPRFVGRAVTALLERREVETQG